MMEQVILVDENDRAIGVGEKIRTHREGALHRAFSIFVFDADKRLLLQKRASTKYHSGGLWSNTCCGHPRPGESIEAAAHRRLREEMSFDCDLQLAFKFLYKTSFENSLIEYEYDYVFVGEFNGEPTPDIDEAEDWAWVSMKDLRRELNRNADQYSYWLRAAVNRSEWKRLNEIARVEG